MSGPYRNGQVYLVVARVEEYPTTSAAPGDLIRSVTCRSLVDVGSLREGGFADPATPDEAVALMQTMTSLEKLGEQMGRTIIVTEVVQVRPVLDEENPWKT